MKWKFTLIEDVSLTLPIKLKPFYNDWCIINGYNILIKQGYSWDGCTPKLKIGDLGYIGTPDGALDMNTGLPKTYFCSLVHDVLYQWKKDHQVTRFQADLIFLLMLKEIEFSKSEIYFNFVRLFGGFYGKWNKK